MSSSIKKYYFSCDPDFTYLNTSFCGSFNSTTNFIYGPTCNDKYILNYVKSGKVLLTFCNKTYNLKAGCSFMIFPGYLYSHSADNSEPWCYHWIEVYGSVLDKFLQLSELTPDNPVHEHTNLAVIDQVISELFEKYTTNNKQCELSRIMLIHRYFIEMINDLRRPHIETPLLENVQINKYIRKSIDYILENYSKHLTINDIAYNVGLERSYFSKLFKKVTGTMPSSYLLNYRMSKARFLLMQTSYKIDEIAQLIGYKTTYEFTKMFKIWAWMTPSEFRKHNKNTTA